MRPIMHTRRGADGATMAETAAFESTPAPRIDPASPAAVVRSATPFSLHDNQVLQRPSDTVATPDVCLLPPHDPPRSWSRVARFSVRPLLALLDLLAVVAVLTATVAIGTSSGTEAPGPGIAVFGVSLLVLFRLGGLYRSRLSLSVLDDLPVLVGRWLAAAAVCVLVQIAGSATIDDRYLISWRFLWGAAVILVLVLALRALGYWLVRWLRRERVVAHRTLIIGGGSVGVQVAEVLRRHPEYGLAPIGFLDSAPPTPAAALPLPVLGGPDALNGLLQHGQVNTVVVAFSTLRESEMVRLIRTCDRFRCELFVVPRLFELHQVESTMDHAWGFPLVRLRRATYRSRAWRLKRVIDVLVSAAALLVVAPLLLVLALAVRLDGGPGVLFRQQRVGVDGRHFELLKFRSLRPATVGESQTMWTVADDPRMSRLGKFLRTTSLDELPQLYNVLRGDMSLVGPRPERPHFVSQFRERYPSYEARHRVPSGLTGWAQVHGLRGDTSIADRARFDNYYIENWSLWLDIKIILRTFAALVRRDGV
jgi:exopolysaccharide biosynthesis polyprenyl glycosylphosphotransferase